MNLVQIQFIFGTVLKQRQEKIFKKIGKSYEVFVIF